MRWSAVWKACLRVVTVATCALACISGPLPAAAATPDDIGVLALGDSVMLGAQPCLERAGYTVDARGSRSPRAGIEVLRAMAHDLPPRLVVHLGTNGGIEPEQAEEVMSIAGPTRQVTWLTVQLPDDTPRYTFEERSNDTIHRVVAAHPNARLADWNVISDRRPGLVWPEGIHLTPVGCRAYARIVRAALAMPDLALRPVRPGLIDLRRA